MALAEQRGDGSLWAVRAACCRVAINGVCRRAFI